MKTLKTNSAQLAKDYIDSLNMIIVRQACGCLGLDCRKHGSYIPSLIELKEKIIDESFE